MIEREEIRETLNRYDRDKLTLAVLCSHSALQIVHGAKLEGFRTIGICPEERKRAYSAFMLARPDEFMVVDRFADILDEENQRALLDSNAIVMPHGSFVEYVGAERLLEEFHVPMFGNRNSLRWEAERGKQREWLERAGLSVPRQYKDPSEIEGKAFVKFSGAKGGRGFFTISSEDEYEMKMERELERGTITEEDAETVTIQEFVSGVRYYPHYFHSLFDLRGAAAGDGAIEILGMDRRIEPIDECYRGLPDVPQEFFDYTVTGNEPLAVREKLLVDLIEMGTEVVLTSRELFPPGMNGPFCLETVYHPSRGFTAFEISGRIVAGTNLFPTGSPYSAMVFEEPMSMGRRMAREIRDGSERGELERAVY